jgi:hypothetical protein
MSDHERLIALSFSPGIISAQLRRALARAGDHLAGNQHGFRIHFSGCGNFITTPPPRQKSDSFVIR